MRQKYLLVEHRFVEDSLVVALDSGFGCGKTTFLRMWEHDLVSRRDAGDMTAPMPLVLNAWESDHCGDPLVAIMAALLDHLDQWKVIQAPDKTILTECAKDIAWLSVGLANQAVVTITGLDMQNAADFAEKKKAARNPARPDLLAAYRDRVSALERLQTGLTRVFGADAPKLLVIVDELDRCRPDYAVSYLETIKHVFAIRGMVFVLSLDLEQFKHSVGALYGADLDFKEYFRKFAHRTVRLPEIPADCMKKAARHYVEKYISVPDLRVSLLNTHVDITKCFTEMLIAFQMRPRQILEVFRIIGHTMAVEDPNKEGNAYEGYAPGSILLGCLKVGKPELFRRICASPPQEWITDLAKMLVTLLDPRGSEWWLKTVILGSLHVHRADTHLISKLLEVASLRNPNIPVVDEFQHEFFSMWPTNSSFVRLALKMDIAEVLEET